jgi:hypothetical protein
MLTICETYYTKTQDDVNSILDQIGPIYAASKNGMRRTIQALLRGVLTRADAAGNFQRQRILRPLLRRKCRFRASASLLRLL